MVDTAKAPEIVTQARKSLSPSQALSVCSTAKRIDGGPDLKLVCHLNEAKLSWQLGQEERAVWLLSSEEEMLPTCSPLLASKVLTQAAKWSLSRRAEPSSAVLDRYLKQALELARTGFDLQLQAKLHFLIATVSSAIYEGLTSSENMAERNQLLRQARASLQALQQGKTRSTENSRSIAQLEGNYRRDVEEYEGFMKQSNQYLGMAMDGFLQALALSDKHDYAAFRLCSLWLKEHDNPQVMASIRTFIDRVPLKKFIPLIYQLSARLSTIAKKDETPLAKELAKLLYRLCTSHPHSTLIQILALRGEPRLARSTSKRRLVDPLDDKNMDENPIHELWARLRANPEMAPTLQAYERLVSAYVELSQVPVSKDARIGAELSLETTLQIYRLRDFANLPIITSTNSATTIAGVSPWFKVVGGINVPKIIDVTGSDGRIYRQLVKGHDDLRQVIELASSLGCGDGASVCAGAKNAPV